MLTIVKILAADDHPAKEDIERWRKIFEEQSMTPLEAVETGEVSIEYISPCEQCITLVKIGNDNFRPSAEDLENWRKVFEEAQNNTDFKIFTHPAVDISVIPVGKIIAVE